MFEIGGFKIICDEIFLFGANGEGEKRNFDILILRVVYRFFVVYLLMLFCVILLMWVN